MYTYSVHSSLFQQITTVDPSVIYTYDLLIFWFLAILCFIIYNIITLSAFLFVITSISIFVNDWKNREIPVKLDIPLEPQSLINLSLFNLPQVDNQLPKLLKLTVHSLGFFRDIKNYQSPLRHEVFSNAVFSVVRYVLCYYSTIAEVISIVNIIFNYGKGAALVLQPQAINGIPMLRGILTSWDNLSSSDLTIKFQNVLIGMISCSLLQGMKLPFTELGFHHLIGSKQLKTTDFTSPSSLIHSVLDFMVTFLETGHECFQEKSLQPLLIRDRTVRLWHTHLLETYADYDNKANDPDFNAADMLARLDNLISRGTTLLITHSREIQLFMKELMDRRTRLKKQHNVATFRRAPYSVLLHGPPGIGKSSITQLIGTIYHTTVKTNGIYPNLEWDPRQNMYSKNSEDQFWSGYIGSLQWLIVLDDIARETAKQVSSKGSESISSVLTIINNIGVATNQASLENKGSIGLTPKCVIATTNTQHLNASFAVSNPDAILRRFPVNILPILKKEFQDELTGTMSKMTYVEHNAWYYKVQLVSLSKANSVDGSIRTSYIHQEGTAPDKNMTGAEMSAFLAKHILAHERSQDVMQQSLKVAPTTQCEHGVISLFTCVRCNPPTEPQTLGDYIPSLFRKKLTHRERFGRWCSHIYIDYAPDFIYAYDNISRLFVDSEVVIRETIGRIPPHTQLMVATFYPILTGIAASILTCAILAMLPKWDPEKEAKKEEDVINETKCTPQAPINYWTSYTKNSTFTIPARSRPASMEHLKMTITKGTFIMAIKTPNGDGYVKCLSLKNGWYLTVAHPFFKVTPEQSWPCVVRYADKEFSLDPRSTFYLTEFNIRRLPNDLVMFFSANIRPFKELYDFLPESVDEAGREILISDLESTEGWGIGHTTHYKSMSYRGDFGEIISGKFLDGTRTDRAPRRGDCGSVIISKSGKSMYISGIHCAGTADPVNFRMVVTQISRNMFDCTPPSLSYLQAGDMVQPMAGSTKSGPMVPCHPVKGIHNWAEGNAQPVGSYIGRTTMRSRVQLSCINSQIQDAFHIKNEFCAPVMEAQFIGGEWVNPFTISATAQASITPFLTDELVHTCATSYISDCLQDDTWLENTGVVDMEIAINGIPGDTYINCLPMNTSGGFYFPGSKRLHFTQEDLPDGLIRWHPSVEVLQMVNTIENLYKDGERANPLFNASLKDEPISLAKKASGRTRVFTACDVAFSIVVRKQYLRITKAIMINNFITECAVSMNCYSIEWSEIYDFVCQFGPDRIIAGDYKEYDKRMPASAIRAAFLVLDTLRSHLCPLSEEDRIIGVGIATDICYPLTNMNGDVIQFLGGNSSGHPLTVIINSIVNSIYVRCAYFCQHLDLSQFRSNVALMTLGDDNIMGSKLDEFNHTSIQHSLGLLGIPYTMAVKDKESVPFIDISEADFLKRTFTTLRGQIVGPLALKSIWKSLMMYVERGNISHEEQLAQSYLSARREWSLHGKDIFTDNTLKMSQIFTNFPLVQRFMSGPQYSYTYDETLSWVLNSEEVIID